MSTMIATLDEKGRLVVPKSVRQRDELESGDMFIVDPNSAAGTITFVRVESPLKQALNESRAEYEAGLGITLEELAAELGIDLSGE